MIGGEFDIDITRIRNAVNTGFADNIAAYSSGRSALYNILADVRRKHGSGTVILPDYLCSSILVSVKHAGMQYVFCPIDDSLEFDRNQFSAVYKPGYAVLMINYFGLMDLSSQVRFIRSTDPAAIIIEDDVQAYYEFTGPLAGVDYKFTSLRKTFAVPDGGLAVCAEGHLDERQSEGSFYKYKMAGSVLKANRNPLLYNDEIYLKLFEKGEECIDLDLESRMSEISRRLFGDIDASRVAYIRNRNAGYILAGLKSMGIEPILPISEDKVPLFVPVWLKDRNKVRKNMFKHDVYCPYHWPIDGLPLAKGKEMSEHELSIIIDQRYGHVDMDLILNLISDSL